MICLPVPFVKLQDHFVKETRVFAFKVVLLVRRKLKHPDEGITELELIITTFFPASSILSVCGSINFIAKFNSLT